MREAMGVMVAAADSAHHLVQSTAQGHHGRRTVLRDLLGP